MRNQFFGDNHDLFKYDLLLTILLNVKEVKSLFFIPMLTPDLRIGHSKGHGNKANRVRASAGYRNRDLSKFLDERIKEKPRDFRKIKVFFHNHSNKKIIIYKSDCYFSHQNRKEYFKGIENKLLQSSLIFLDPDNGLEVQRSGEKHLLYKEIENLYIRMGKDSIIAIIQFFPRENHFLYLKMRYNELKSCFGKMSLYIFDSRIIFFFLTKNLDLYKKLTRVIEFYKNIYSQLK